MRTDAVPARRVIRARDCRVMPWKNGLGTTTEIAVEPEDAGLSAFTWRISIADLTTSGPFSTFAGYDRILVQIAGEPMTLTHEGSSDHRLALLEPHRFAGELATIGTIVSPARDFNVMVRRERARADLVVHRLGDEESVSWSATGETRVVFVLDGSLLIHGYQSTEDIELRAGETLVTTEISSLGITAGGGGATAFFISISAVPS
ncbi:Hypothetical protein A7982_06742 [Minicystis rosea]|nr:Hypothetical protein A7982_06742 [Minicystis rosea]